jgi:hypothetical protein
MSCFAHRLAPWLGACALVLSSASAQGGAAGFSGTLGLQIATVPPAIVAGSGVAAVNGSGGGGHLAALALPAGAFATSGLVIPITDPQVSPIKGIQLTLSNGAGSFAGGPVGGVMPLAGFAKVCFFAACPGSFGSLSVPLAPVGAGGAATAIGVINATAVGAPWTTGTAAIGLITVMGFRHGPASAASSTAQPSGVVQLVTPIFVSTNIPGSAVVPSFGILQLHFVPEPASLTLLGSGIAWLAWKRRRIAH